MNDVLSRIEPETVAVMHRLAQWDTTDVASIRSTYRAVAAPPVPADPRVERVDAMIPGLDGRPDAHVRWYRPAGSTGDLPVIMWLHGGAYIMGSLEENDDRLDLMVLELGCSIVSVDWRLAPEHPYPEGLDDAETVWRALADHAEEYRIRTDRMILAGASAGAGLAAALCLRLRERGLPQPRLQLLIYPMLDDREETASIRAIQDDPGHWGLWHIEAQRHAWAAYLGATADGSIPPTAVPARATDLGGLAPAFVGVGEVDAYVDEDIEYARRLIEAGVPTELHVYPGVIHGGFLARPQTPRTRQFLRDAYEALSRAID